MSRFWNGSDSSEESESESSSDESEQQQFKKQTDRKFAAAFDESDSDSEDEVREVKSQKDRSLVAVYECVSKLRSSMRIEDWSLVVDNFEKMNKQAEKCKDTPPGYVKALLELETLIAATLQDKEKVKSLKPAAGRSLNQLKLKVRKHNENFRKLIDDCKANPEKFEDEVVKSSRKDDSDSDSDSYESDSSSSSSSSSSESESETELTGRARWLKKPAQGETRKKDTEKVEKEREKQMEKIGRQMDRVHLEKPKAEVAVSRIEMTEKELDEKVSQLIASRGRKGVDQREMVRGLELLSKVARTFGPNKEIPVLMHLISAMFDSLRSIDDFMDLSQWNSCFRSLNRVVSLLSQHSDLRLRLFGEDEEGSAAAAPRKEDEKVSFISVAGSLESFIVKLEEEYNKSLQQINPHTKDYVARLANEANLTDLEEKILAYYKRVGDLRSAAAVALLIVEHMYYKHDTHAKAVTQSHAFSQKWGSASDLHPACKGSAVNSSREVEVCHPAAYCGHPTVTVVAVDYCSKLEDLCSFIFNYGDERNKTRALLSCVYYHALHDNYYRARDLFLLSHVQDFIDKAEIRTQVLYNRAVVNLGLCAFRMGLFAKAHDCLSNICSGRTKELLAQGTSRSNDKDAEQEKLERRRQMPYHMHINPDLLECCHLTCAMILELPHLARGIATGSSSAVVSRQLRKHLATYNKQPFVGPPETTREHVLAATKAILGGDWRKACHYLLDLEVWNLIPSDKGAHIKVLLKSRIQEEAIRCHLLLNCNSYDSVELDTLCLMFDLEHTPVRKIICHMIFNKEISASWESSGHVLTIYKVEPSALQLSAQAMAEKLGHLLESNERIVDTLVGVYGYKDDGNARDAKKSWSSGQDNSGLKKGRHFGLKSSHRPVVQKGGNRTVRSGRNGNKDGMNSNMSKHWGQKNRRGEDE